MERERENGFVAVKSVSQGNYLKRNVFKKRETERDRERVIIKERREESRSRKQRAARRRSALT